MSLAAVTRVLLVEDHTIVREGLRALLVARDGIEVVGEVGRGAEAVAEALRLRPDVVLMDVNLPDIDGIEATRRIHEVDPGIAILMLSMHAEAEHVRPALRAGARGYLVKGSGLSDLVAAVAAVAAGNSFLSPEVAKVVLEPGGSPGRAHELTPREMEVLCLVAEGCSSAEIARRLGLSVKTVEGHRGRLMSKLDANNAAALVRHALRLGLVSRG
jgi:DNA-binding NarL/FixJ family response regulator